jgi:hypothetical protein
MVIGVVSCVAGKRFLAKYVMNGMLPSPVTLICTTSYVPVIIIPIYIISYGQKFPT